MSLLFRTFAVTNKWFNLFFFAVVAAVFVILIGEVKYPSIFCPSGHRIAGADSRVLVF